LKAAFATGATTARVEIGSGDNRIVIVAEKSQTTDNPVRYNEWDYVN
jgi:hypothetical protein